jgi:hypothetical protein
MLRNLSRKLSLYQIKCSAITESLQALNSQPQIKTTYNMADSTPKPDSAPPQHETNNHNSDLKGDDIIENSIGEFGCAQFFRTVLVSLAYMFDSQQVYISVFTDAFPTLHCTSNSTACTSTSNTCLWLPSPPTFRCTRPWDSLADLVVHQLELYNCVTGGDSWKNISRPG